ncbi:Multidrug resistance-associated protein 1 [Mortierella sp. GBA30]|nr:Multidrug resistance-associated protein 1 [Mortierella sp. GBA30]
MYEIRSSTAISGFYILSITSTLAILHTRHDLMVGGGETDSAQGSATSWPLALFALVLSFGFVVEAWPRGSTQVQRLSGAPEYVKANIFSRMTFYFFQPVVTIGIRRTLTTRDINNLLPDDIKTDHAYRELSTRWNARLQERRTHKGQTPSLFWTAIRTHFVSLIPIIICRLIIVAMTYTLPLLQSLLLTYLQDYEDKPLSYGVSLACSMFLVSLVIALLYTYNRYQIFLYSFQTKAALISMVYRKALRLSPGSRMKSTTGEIMNHMAVDAEQWGDALAYLSNWISIPVEIIVALVMLYKFLGWSMIAGFLAMLLFLPVQAWQAKIYKKLQGKKLKAMDLRVRMTTEILAGVKVVKIYGWESAFLRRIMDIRIKELLALRTIGVVQAFMSIVFISSSLIISLITFGVYARWGGPNFTPGKLTPQTVFVSMTIFAMLKSPIALLSDAITSTIIVMVGTRRIQDFLLREEVQEADIVRSKTVPQDPQEPVILIKDASFYWTAPTDGSEDGDDGQEQLLWPHRHQHCPESTPTLQSIGLSILNEKLVAVVGRVGQGKSSLLSAIIGEMYKLQGLVKVSGQIAYVPQQAWIINATLRDNILFGKEFDESKYKEIIFACGLESDIAILAQGDFTEIGERGINLSGGQKQRVSLARSVYQDADIYLLDDPLSAVDAHVDKHLWDNVIGPAGLLRSKTRVLVTHGIHHLKEVDQIVVLKDGTIAEQGHYNELMRTKQTFYQLIKEYSVSHAKEARRKIVQRKDSGLKASTLGQPQPHSRAGTDTLGHQASASQEGSATTGVNESEGDSASFDEITTSEDEGGRAGIDEPANNREDPQNNLKDLKPTKAQPSTAEKSKDGHVGLGTALVYICAMPLRNFTTILGLLVLGQACFVGTSMWLRYWIKKTEDDKDEDGSGGAADSADSVNLFLAGYALLTFVYVAIFVLVSWLNFAVGRIRASEILHRNLVTKILRLPMSFFDITPLGRISGYWTIQVCFLRISNAAVRLYSVSKSPVYQHFNESLNGVSSIRASLMQDRFIKENVRWTDNMANHFLLYMTSKRWVEVQLRLLTTLILLFTALFAVLGRSSIDPSLVGLTMTFTLSLTEEVTSFVRIFCDFLNQLVAVERVVEYTEMKTEAPAHTDVRLPPNWPSHGSIRFRNYSTRYREGLDLVIKDISLDILPAQKIGIVGRTGAGKSSLTLALFRIVESANSYWAKASDNTGKVQSDSAAALEINSSDSQTLPVDAHDDNEEEDGGSIEIDGIDISTIGLEDLRQHLAIIPQEPTLFAGTVRDNLDPFQQLEDADLWEALDRSHLKNYIRSLPGGLSFEVSQNGENFSVGQRSLICLARALLRKTKILVMDEATAAVDVETDELIQRTIREEFKDSTVLTIAHRIKTVMDSDKILVLERGRVQEFEAPKELLKNSNSLFYKLAEQAGEI